MILIDRGYDGNLVIINEQGKVIGHVQNMSVHLPSPMRMSSRYGEFPVTMRHIVNVDLSFTINHEDVSAFEDLYSIGQTPRVIGNPTAMDDIPDIKHKYREVKKEVKPGRFNQIMHEVHDDE